MNSANEWGPFSLDRAGGLPVGEFARLCFSGRYSEGDIRRKLTSGSGLRAYIGTSDMLEVNRRIHDGDETAAFYRRAMV